MTEQELIEGCIRQDRVCQKCLFDKFSGSLMTICLRYANNKMDADDMMQEGFIAIFKNIKQFKSEGSLEGWLRKIVVNKCIQILQRNKINFISLDETNTNIADDTKVYNTDLKESDLMKLINALPIGYKTVFNLFVIEGFSHEEIAEMLHIQTATSRTQLVKARKILQSQIVELKIIAV